MAQQTNHIGDINKMVTINKEFIPYEQALELKKLGFDEPCFAWYNDNGNYMLGIDEVRFDTKKTYHFNNTDSVSAPLYQQAFRWFREKKLSDSYVYRYQDRTDGSINYGYSIINDYGIEETRFIKENYITYEEAELACLKKLIEIVKNK